MERKKRDNIKSDTEKGESNRTFYVDAAIGRESQIQKPIGCRQLLAKRVSKKSSKERRCKEKKRAPSWLATAEILFPRKSSN